MRHTSYPAYHPITVAKPQRDKHSPDSIGSFKTEVPSLGKTTRLVAAAKPNCSEHCQRQFCKQQQTQATSHPTSLQQQFMNLCHWNQLLEPSKPKLADMQLLAVPPN